MTEPENFLTRWSKRKLASRTESSVEQTDSRRDGLEQSTAGDDDPILERPRDGEAPPTAAEAFDVASLPALDSIDANSDVAAFLRPGVPADLTRAALRRAWSSDPAIRDFIGLVENGWDFNDPSAMPGFGPISPAEVARLAAKVVGALPEDLPESSVAAATRQTSPQVPCGETEEPLAIAADGAEPQGQTQNDATQKSEPAGDD